MIKKIIQGERKMARTGRAVVARGQDLMFENILYPIQHQIRYCCDRSWRGSAEQTCTTGKTGLIGKCYSVMRTSASSTQSVKA